MRRVHADVGEESSHPTMLTLASADRGVAQPGQSIGLQNRGPEVRILTPLPLAFGPCSRGAGPYTARAYRQPPRHSRSTRPSVQTHEPATLRMNSGLTALPTLPGSWPRVERVGG